MMICPESYIEEHKNDTFEQLIEERNELIKEIKHLEGFIFGDIPIPDEEYYHPTPDVRYQMNLEYLSALCKFICEKYNKEVVWGESLES